MEKELLIYIDQKKEHYIKCAKCNNFSIYCKDNIECKYCDSKEFIKKKVKSKKK